jgi:hypothetical protein
MKMLVGSFAFVALLLILFFGGMIGNQTGLLMFSSMGFCLFGNPILWIAIYRAFTGAAGGRIAWVPADGRNTKIVHKNRTVGGDL